MKMSGSSLRPRNLGWRAENSLFSQHEPEKERKAARRATFPSLDCNQQPSSLHRFTWSSLRSAYKIFDWSMSILPSCPAQHGPPLPFNMMSRPSMYYPSASAASSGTSNSSASSSAAARLAGKQAELEGLRVLKEQSTRLSKEIEKLAGRVDDLVDGGDSE